MLPLKTTRSALAAYGALLVLPTLVFGWLYWRELLRDYDAQLAAVPEDAEDTARRIVGAMRGRLDRLVDEEGARPFYQYGQAFAPPEAMGDEISLQPSPLVQNRRPPAILAWFNFDITDPTSTGIDSYLGSTGATPEGEEALARTLAEFRIRRAEDTFIQRLAQIEGLTPESIPLSAVAVLRGHKRDTTCVMHCAPFMVGRTLPVRVSSFEKEFYLDSDGTPIAIVSRLVHCLLRKGDIPPEAACLQPLLGTGFLLQQGFLIDPEWLLGELPEAVAEQVLGESEELISLAPALPIQEERQVYADILPVRELGFTTLDPSEDSYGQLDVAINTEGIRRRFEKQSRRFMAVAAMMVLTLAAGMALLYRSVGRELAQAQKMQNFVAAVTHELRTPVSTIQLHGEMLLEGWTSDPQQKREYYGRIVRETKRLAVLVERVLEKSRLKEKRTEPVPTDLNRAIEARKADLASPEDADDLAFDLAPDLPPVLLTGEALGGILSNLVENARKYAPVPPGGEPILVRTRAAKGTVLLEVLDRGPGIPPAERERVFEAFYRMGSEATRTSTGTGLGLHLVALHAESVDARASAGEREGGGGSFRVALRPAPAPSPARARARRDAPPGAFRERTG